MQKRMQIILYNIAIYPKSAIRACLDFVWLLMSNSELLRIKNGQKTPYKKQKTASSYKKK